MKSLFFLFVTICLITTASKAQHENNIKFGKIDVTDFTINSTVVDSTTNAVVIADIGSSDFEGNNKGWFTLVYKRIKRVKIINQKGYNAAEVGVLLYTDNGYYQATKNKEQLLDLKGATYNLDNGKITTATLDAASVYETRVDKNRVEKKFALPAVKAGSIIEYSYTIKSDFIFNLQPWYFQCEYPCLWSEYTVHIPDCFAYIFLSKGYNQFYINEKKTAHAVYKIEDPEIPRGSYVGDPQTYLINSFVAVNKWVIKDVPALKEETMLSTKKNYASQIEFQLAQYRFSDPPENKMNDWLTVNKELFESDDFGHQLDENSWLATEDNNIVDNNTGSLEKAKMIYAFVRDNFSNNGKSSGIFLTTDASLKNIYKRKSGSVSDINLLLTAMLRYAGIKADPVILSTREHGVVHPVYPILERYNYTICRVVINDTKYYLDASDHLLGFNRLTGDCYNGNARVVGADTAVVLLSKDSLKEVSNKSIFLSSITPGNLSGTFQSTIGYNESLSLRIKLEKLSLEDFFKKLQQDYPSSIVIQNGSIDSLKKYDNPVRIKYDIACNCDSHDSMVYVNPMFGQELKQNPFKSETERLYPIEMPYCPNQLLLVNMEIPDGYKVEEIPKSARIKLENDEGFFEYLIQQNEHSIQLQCTLKINKAIYPAEDYTTLRNFYTYLINKESERIILRKAN